MDRLRVPFFLAAFAALALALLVELAASELLARLTGDRLDPETPGLAINYLAIFDGLLFYTFCLNALSIAFPKKAVAVGQIIANVVLSFFAFLGSIPLILIALTLLILMVSLLVAVPFGTIAYVAAWGHFATGAAAATLLIAMALKIAFCIFAALSHQRYLQNKGLLVLAGVSILFTWIVGFLHAFPPGFLVSIADAIGALVLAIVGAVWLLVLLIASIIALVTNLPGVLRPT